MKLAVAMVHCDAAVLWIPFPLTFGAGPSRPPVNKVCRILCSSWNSSTGRHRQWPSLQQSSYMSRHLSS